MGRKAKSRWRAPDFITPKWSYKGTRKQHEVGTLEGCLGSWGLRGPQEEGVGGQVAMMACLLTIHTLFHPASHGAWRWAVVRVTSLLLQMRKLRPTGMEDVPGIPQLGGGGVRAVTIHCRTQGRVQTLVQF